MRRIIAAAALLIAPSLFAHDHGQNVSISTDDYEEVTSCGQIRVSFDDAPAVRAEEELPVASLRSLKIKETLTLKTVSLPCRVEISDGLIRVEKADLTCDLGSATLTG